MSPDTVALLVGVITIVTSFVASIKWLVNHYLSELKPDGNGGHNLEGRIRRMESRIDDLYSLMLQNDKPVTRRKSR
jgi:hypothetical protein